MAWSAAGPRRRCRRRSRRRARRRGVVELLLLAEEEVEDLVAHVLGQSDRQPAADEGEEDQLPEAAAALAVGAFAEGEARLLERVGRVLDVLLELLVLHDDLGGRLAVRQAGVCAAGVVEGILDVRAQLLVLNEALNVVVAPRPLGGSLRLLGLALRHPAPPWVDLRVLRRSYTRALEPARGRRWRRARGARPFEDGGARAVSKTSVTRSTKTNRRSRRRCSGISSTSASFGAGAITVSIPLRWAASAFSFSPPIGSTCPVSVTSPVIATSSRTQRPLMSEASAVVIVMPALGPSFGVAPAGTWMWMSWPANQSSPSPGAISW